MTVPKSRLGGRKKRRRAGPRKKKTRPPLHERENMKSDDPLEKPCFRADSVPEGYVFVAKGDPYVTRNCKTQSKAQGSVVYMVYDSKGKEQLGIRVKQEIYSHITDLASQTAKDRAKAVLLRDARDQKKAQEVLKETFPKIPAHCAERILKHSFLKGSGRVGRTTTKSAEKKAQLAVEAHLRHEHTSYDRLLDDGAGREDARAAVRNVVQGMKDQWAGKSKIEVYLAGDCGRSRQRSSSSVASR